MRSTAVIVAVAIGAVAGCGGAGSPPPAAGPASAVSTKLTGAAEVSRGSGTGSATAVVTLNAKTGRACWTLSVTGIGHPLSAHIHRGVAGRVGPVVIPLGGSFARQGCVLAPVKAIVQVGTNPGNYYVNVHTRAYLNGAIRGQLRAGSTP